jgi:hypothetical protein
MAAGEKKEPISVSLDGTTVSILDDIAASDMSSRSAVAERALWEYYGRRFTSTPKFRAIIANHVSSLHQD